MCLGGCNFRFNCDPENDIVLYIRMRRQAERWGAELFQEDVEFLDVKTIPFTVQSSERKVIYAIRNLSVL